MKKDVLDINGNVKEQIELSDAVFNIEPNEYVIYESVKNILANKRQGTHSSKTRAEVHGTTRKPYRQKGTGRARAGTTKSPIWRHGGIIFGPKPRDYGYSIPKKVKRRALFSILSLFNKNDDLLIVEDINFDKYSTKQADKIFKSLTDSNKILFYALKNNDEDSNYDYLVKSVRNLPYLNFVNIESINTYDIYVSKKLIFTKSAIEKLNDKYQKVK